MADKLLIALFLMASPAVAMEPRELTVAREKAIPTDITKQRVVVQIQGHEREIPTRYIPLIGTLAALYKEGSPLQMSPITLVTPDIWKLIEDQLERVYAITQGNGQVRNEIITDYSQLTVNGLIELILAVDFLAISPLREITLQVAENKLTLDEILELPAYVRNDIVKSKVISLVGPVPGRQRAVYSGHKDQVNSVFVATDGKIVSTSADRTVQIWDMSGRFTILKGYDSFIPSICITSDGKIVAGSCDNTVRIWSMDDKKLAVCRGHKKRVTSVCVTPDEKIVSGSDDNTVRIWSINGNQLKVCRGHEERVTSVCVTWDNKIVSGSEDGTVRIWDMDGNQLNICRGHEKRVTSVCVTPNEKIISGADNTVCVWSMDGQQLAVYRGKVRWLHSLCVTADSKIVLGSGDGTVRVMDMNGAVLAVCRGHIRGISSVCVTNDNKIVSGSGDGTIRIWDISLLDRLSVMNKEQAQAIGKFVRSANCENKEQKESFWEMVTKILEKE